ncbi:MAG: hypothetical protein JW801_01525 [Bacteroidales bacterium]|nr:hypothetical protein [Bacteroidales bacterium]
MSLGNALKFVRQVSKDNTLRDRCNSSRSREELLHALKFDEGDFENAINMQLVKCQTYEEADVVQEIRMWFSLL